MILSETAQPSAIDAIEPSSPKTLRAQLVALADAIQSCTVAESASLRRLDPERPRPHQIAAVTRLLLQAELSPEFWSPLTWQRWALVAHGMALVGHDGSESLGGQLHRAEVSEARVTRLLTARAEGLRQLLPPLLRLMNSKQVAPNWNDLGPLILLDDGESLAQQDARRLRIASHFFRAQVRTEKSITSG